MRKIVTRRNLKEEVYQRLKQGIINRELPPGARLIEEDLSEKLGVSRTPLREAISRLHQEGIIKLIPNRGAYVAWPTFSEIMENLYIREVLEGLAARLAAENISIPTLNKLRQCMEVFVGGDLAEHMVDYSKANVKFHRMIVEASRSKRLIHLINNLYDQMDIVRLRTIYIPGRAEKSLIEHLEILKALEKRDGLLAEKLLRAHVADLREALKDGKVLRDVCGVPISTV